MFLNILESQDKLPDLIRKASGMTMEIAMKEGTNIQSLKRLNADKPELLEGIVYSLLDYSRSCLMVENTKDQQICLINLAVHILNDPMNNCFSLEEIILCIQNGASGKYGKNYHKITQETVNKWLDEYYQERDDFIYKKHLELKNSSGNQADRASKGNEAADEFNNKVNDEVKRRMGMFYQRQRELKNDENK